MNNIDQGFRKTLRKNQTDAEKLLWFHLRGRRLKQLKFRRQVSFDNYIADFVCFEKMLVIEVDGGQHNENRNRISDGFRTKFLERNGYRVLRFWNDDVLNNVEGVINIILETI